jgi:VWFA-related protein
MQMGILFSSANRIGGRILGLVRSFATFAAGGRQMRIRIIAHSVVRCCAFAALLFLFMAPRPASGQNSLPDAPVPQNNAPAPPAETAPQAPDRPSVGAESSQEVVPKPAQAQPRPEPGNDMAEQPAPPKPGITTLAPGQHPSGEEAPRERLFTLSKELNFVQVPVTVKDDSGRLTNGLLSRNFSVLENGVQQHIEFFTSDPFPISAALVIDVNLPNTALDRIKETFSALTGAFSQFDELAVYTYGNTVRAQQGFLGALSDKTAATLRTVRKIEGQPSGPSVADNPMTSGPSVNGRQFPDTGRSVSSMDNRAYPESAVLNDAILQAGADLGHRESSRRRVLFVVSDGREKGSTASYEDVKKVLLTNNITFFAVGADTAAIPIYDKLSRVRLPRQGYGNILPKYASATGGEVLAEFSRSAIEAAYSRLMEQARNQYTLGYYSNAPKGSISYRSIEIRVNRPKLKVYARDGYYPVPPAAK